MLHAHTSIRDPRQRGQPRPCVWGMCSKWHVYELVHACVYIHACTYKCTYMWCTCPNSDAHERDPRVSIVRFRLSNYVTLKSKTDSLLTTGWVWTFEMSIGKSIGVLNRNWTVAPILGGNFWSPHSGNFGQNPLVVFCQNTRVRSSAFVLKISFCAVVSCVSKARSCVSSSSFDTY